MRLRNDVQYDDQYRFPRLISLDEDRDVVDDELAILVTSFAPLPGA